MIRDFLIEAKKSTYANGTTEKIESNRLGSKDYEYKKDNMLYHDTYFNKIYWAMNYYGVTLDENLGEEAMDNALRPALMQVGVSENIIPVRGPREYKNGDFKYTFEVSGDLTNFSGIETIYKNDKKVYELKCNGGLIK